MDRFLWATPNTKEARSLDYGIYECHHVLQWCINKLFVIFVALMQLYFQDT